MNFRAGRPKKGGASIDFTPIVDTVFNLIIFFALSLNFIGTPAISLRLPQASAKESVKESREVRVFVTRAYERDGYTFGNFIVDGQKLGQSELETLINQRIARDRDTVVIIQADERVSQGEVVRIMDLAKSAGVDKIAIATRPREK